MTRGSVSRQPRSQKICGKIHDFQRERDKERDLIIKSLGLNVLHIKNEEIDDMEEAKLKIKSELDLAARTPLCLVERGQG